MKIVFAGTPAFAVPAFRAVHAAFGVAAVLTQPDKPQGRKHVPTPSPVKQAALGCGVPVLQPARLRDDLSALKAVGADLMVTCAYGQILTKETLGLFPLGVWNVHASLLPKYRGAAPVAAAIAAGERETGVTIMKTDVGLDTGDMFLQERLPISDTDTCGTLTEKLASLGLERGVEIVSVGPGKIMDAGVSEGFVILYVNDQPVSTPKDVMAIVKKTKRAVFIEGVTSYGKPSYFGFGVE